MVGALCDKFSTSGWCCLFICLFVFIFQLRRNEKEKIQENVRKRLKCPVVCRCRFLPVANDVMNVAIVNDEYYCYHSILLYCRMYVYCQMMHCMDCVGPMQHSHYVEQLQLHLYTLVMDMAHMKLMDVVIIVHAFVVTSNHKWQKIRKNIHESQFFLFLQTNFLSASNSVSNLPNSVGPMCNCDELMVNLEYLLLQLQLVMAV